MPNSTAFDAFKRRFWDKVNVGSPEECWTWKKKFSGHYPYFSLFQKDVPAHRASFYFTHGSIPEGAYICHKCDNKACVNPSHLYAGTQKQNIADAISRNRFVFLKARKGTELKQAILTEEIVSEMRRLHKTTNLGFKTIGYHFGVRRETAEKAIKGVNWKHVSEPPSQRRKILCCDSISEIKRRHKTGESTSSIASTFNVHPQTIRRVVSH